MQEQLNFNSTDNTQQNFEEEALNVGLEMVSGKLSQHKHLSVSSGEFTKAQIDAYCNHSNLTVRQRVNSQGFSVFLKDKIGNLEFDFDVFVYPCDDKGMMVAKVYDAYSFAYIHRDGHIERMTKEKIVRGTFRGNVEHHSFIYDDVQTCIFNAVNKLVNPDTKNVSI